MREENLFSSREKLLFFFRRADVPPPHCIQTLRSVPGNCKVFVLT